VSGKALQSYKCFFNSLADLQGQKYYAEAMPSRLHITMIGNNRFLTQYWLLLLLRHALAQSIYQPRNTITTACNKKFDH
jgi:hypothetical protein